MIVCESCETRNVDAARFCVKCGAALPMTDATAPAPGSWQTPAADLQSAENTGYGDAGSYTASDVRPSLSPSYADIPMSIVPRQLNYASWGDRVIGSIIDTLIFVPVFLMLLLVVSLLLGFADVERWAVGLAATLSVILIVIYNKIYLVGTRGASIGQGVMKLKVVDAAGENVSMGKAALRQIASIGIGLTPILGNIAQIVDGAWPLWDAKRQTLHDKAADAFVIKSGQ